MAWDYPTSLETESEVLMPVGMVREQYAKMDKAADRKAQDFTDDAIEECCSMDDYQAKRFLRTLIEKLTELEQDQ